MPSQSKIKVIGIGPNGECLRKDLIYNADIIAGGKRLLNSFFDLKAEKVILDKNLKSKLLYFKNKKDKNIVILASGDPLFYGIGKLLVDIFGTDNLEFYPYLNSVQLLASKIGINYEDFITVSIHGRKFTDKIIGKIKFNDKIAILTDKKNNINLLSSTLLNYLDKNTEVFLGQMIGTNKEKILRLTLEELKNITPSELDTVFIINKHPNFFRLGIDDDKFIHEAGLITKKEIRVISISMLNLNKDSILWDIGAGSGSVSIEAGNICYEGRVYAFEKNPKRLLQIKENIRKFFCHNVYVIEGSVPESFDGIEKPNRIFIGGFNGDLVELLDKLYNETKALIVANIVSVEKLNSFITFAVSNKLKFEIRSIHIGNLKKLGENHYFKNQNIVYICKILDQ